MNLSLVSMSHVFFRAACAMFSRNTVRLSLPCLLLAGCVTHVPKSAISEKPEEKWPENQLADFLTTPARASGTYQDMKLIPTRCFGCVASIVRSVWNP